MKHTYSVPSEEKEKFYSENFPKRKTICSLKDRDILRILLPMGFKKGIENQGGFKVDDYLIENIDFQGGNSKETSIYEFQGLPGFSLFYIQDWGITGGFKSRWHKKGFIFQTSMPQEEEVPPIYQPAKYFNHRKKKRIVEDKILSLENSLSDEFEQHVGKYRAIVSELREMRKGNEDY